MNSTKTALICWKGNMSEKILDGMIEQYLCGNLNEGAKEILLKELLASRYKSDDE